MCAVENVGEGVGGIGSQCMSGLGETGEKRSFVYIR